MGFTSTIGAFYPNRELLLPVKHIHRGPEQLDKSLVGKELLPHVWNAIDDRFIDRGEVVWVNVKIVAVFLGSTHGHPP